MNVILEIRSNLHKMKVSNRIEYYFLLITKKPWSAGIYSLPFLKLVILLFTGMFET